MAERRSGNPSRRKSSAPAPEQAAFEAVLQGVWSLLKLLFGSLAGMGKGTRPAGSAEQLRQLQEHWQQVEFLLMQEQTRAMAVSEADKLLDAALKLSGLPGQSMGDRLKAAQPRFEANLYQQIWQAHKLRNSLAHEVGMTVSAEQAKQAVAAFRSALYQLKVLS